MLVCGGCEEPLQGNLEVSARAGESFRFAPKHCADGGELGYWGVHLRDDRGRAVDVFKRDDVPHATVYAPGRAAFELDLDACTLFEGKLTRRTVNGSGTMKGDLAFDCDDGAGHVLVGEVSFEDCGSFEEHDDDDDDDDW